MFIDSHCHLDKLDYTEYKSVSNVLRKAQEVGVTHLLAVAMTIDTFPEVVELTENLRGVSISCGVHPLEAKHPFSSEIFMRYCAHERVVAIGETGLDYHHPETAALQRLRFCQQVEAASHIGKPLIIHTRKASKDTLSILREGGAETCRGVIHCFTEDLYFAEAVMEMGFYISVSGIITFRGSEQLRNVVRKIPLDRLLIETDSPYLAPVPYRGKQNQPAYVVEIASCIAKIKNVSVSDIARKTTNNFFELFLNNRKLRTQYDI